MFKRILQVVFLILCTAVLVFSLAALFVFIPFDEATEDPKYIERAITAGIAILSFVGVGKMIEVLFRGS